MVEVLAARESDSQVRRPAGIRIPLNDREGRSPQVLTYFLWDWFDGGLFEGWE